jgi:hypothetical protein
MCRQLQTLLILLPVMSLSASAGVIEFTDRAAWQAAAGAVTNIGFEGVAPAGGRTDFNGPVTFSGVQFSAPLIGGGGIAESVVSAGLDYVNAWGSGDKLQASLGVEFDITLPSGVTAVGSDIMITSTFFLGTTGTYTATLSTGDVFTNIFSSGPPTRSFVGFISTTPITSLTLVSNPSLAMIDNFAFTATAVPEPSSLVLFGAGILALFVLVRKGRVPRKLD